MYEILFRSQQLRIWRQCEGLSLQPANLTKTKSVFKYISTALITSSPILGVQIFQTFYSVSEC
jgi:hypothetical protein